jgi:hypothetical protein
MTKYFHEKNHYILESEKFNPFFETILWMNENEFEKWIKEFRKFIVDVWDKHGVPPKNGYTEEQIIEQFNLIESFDVNQFIQVDELTNEQDVIRNTHTKIGNAVNQWFPTIQKTKINYGASGEGRSIYDYAADDKLLDSFLTMAKRVYRKDSFYLFSNPVRKNNKEYLIAAETAKEWINIFETNRFLYEKEYDYWVQEKEKSKDTGYTGYNLKLREDVMLVLPHDELLEVWDSIPEKCKTTIQKSDIDDTKHYLIRYFKKQQKLFPLLFKSFRVSLCQIPVNFPTLTAKFLYEFYTEDIKEQEKIIIWDPSSGWAGRLLGALGVSADRNIHYIGCDPNEDFTLPDGRLIYDDIAEFYNNRTYRNYGLFPHTNTYQIFQKGSETMQFEPEFQKYKGKIDFIFTSPPYFNREQYSDDETQSYKKFNSYDVWRDEFLFQTLKTAVDWLKPGRYLAWNVADIKIGNTFLPIETDSNHILKKLGMEHVKTWKMALAQMPGANRTDDSGNVTAKNSCKVNNILLKYEPIFVWRKKII